MALLFIRVIIKKKVQTLCKNLHHMKTCQETFLLTTPPFFLTCECVCVVAHYTRGEGENLKQTQQPSEEHHGTWLVTSWYA